MPLAMIGEALALLGAGAYGLAGLSILRGQATARGDNGVFLSVVVTAALSCLLWLVAGRVPLRAVLTGGGLPSLGIFALAGLASIVLGRMTMYRATVALGAVRASLLRRLTPVFAILFAVVLLGEVPRAATVESEPVVETVPVPETRPWYSNDSVQLAAAGGAVFLTLGVGVWMLRRRA